MLRGTETTLLPVKRGPSGHPLGHPGRLRDDVRTGEYDIAGVNIYLHMSYVYICIHVSV